ncbi:MAG: RluA family pseudouridine synthase [bacterium]|nr:RluA family pseudouridine synthase [bacterium]
MKNDPARTATVYHLRPEHVGETLSAVLKDLIPDSSWGQVKKWISHRRVSVNGNLCVDAARRMTDKDVIHFFQQPQSRLVEQRDIRIVFVDDDLLVVEKPAGITTVRHFQERKLSTRRRQVQPTLEEMLPPVLAKIQKLRWPPLPPKGMNRGRFETNLQRGRQRPGHIQNLKKLPAELQVFPVHRLDRDTSGLMLFARNRNTEQQLMQMFKRHAVHRRYTAVCHGTVQPTTIRSWLVRDRGDGIRGSLMQNGRLLDSPPPNDDSAREAVTHVVASQPVADGRYSLVRCKLETGRTHQIRIHLSEAGHPICGDKIYHRLPSGQLIPDESGAPRQALHSDQIAFRHPITGEELRFQMPLPMDLAGWLKPFMTGQETQDESA